ncbi:MAG TPA: tripartite tricarboxylate transporter TctB family protein [Burkholderiales bacterium]
MVQIKSPKDLWAGLMFLGVGLFFAVWAVANYQMGSAVRMGPAYFPAVLGALLAVIGLVVLGGSFVFHGPKVPAFHIRPLMFVLASCLAFGYLMKPLGLVLATAAMVFLAALGGHEFRWKEVTLLSIALVVFSVLVFVKGLTLPFPLWPDRFS